jgi:transposase
MLNQKSEFILEVKSKNSSFSELCRRYGISRPTGYKWVARFEAAGILGLQEQSRRPHTTARPIPNKIITQIVAYRQAHNSWGATKIRKIILREFKEVPSRRSIHRAQKNCTEIVLSESCLDGGF